MVDFNFVMSVCCLVVGVHEAIVVLVGLSLGLADRTDSRLTMRPLMDKEFAVGDGKTEEIFESSKNEDDIIKVKRRKLGADKEMMHEYLSSIDLNPCRLRPRKEMPTAAMETHVSKKQHLKIPALKEVDFKMVDLGAEVGPDIIGRRVEVYWPDSRRWFRGRVKAFDHQKMVHKIDYDDGDKELLDLKNEVFRMQVYPGEIVNIKHECNIKHKPKLLIAKDKDTGERQKVVRAEKGTTVENHAICLGLQEIELVNTSGCPQSLPLVETCPIIKHQDKTPNSAFNSFEDEFLNILQPKSEAEDPKHLTEHFESRMGKKHVLPSSEKREPRLELQNEDRYPVDQLTCTNYYVRRKRP